MSPDYRVMVDSRGKGLQLSHSQTATSFGFCKTWLVVCFLFQIRNQIDMFGHSFFFHLNEMAGAKTGDAQLASQNKVLVGVFSSSFALTC